jgi:hypothetical protein
MVLFPLPFTIYMPARLAPWVGVVFAWLLIPRSSLLVHVVGCVVGLGVALLPPLRRFFVFESISPQAAPGSVV